MSTTTQAYTYQVSRDEQPMTDDGHAITAGMTVYVVTTTYNTGRGHTETQCYASPQRTNRSNEPRVTGWLGETNNIDRHADGAFVVRSWRPRFDEGRVFQGYTVFLTPAEA